MTMKTKSVLKQYFKCNGILLFIAGFSVILLAQDYEILQVKIGWCYLDGGIVQLSQDECQKSGGKYFTTRQEAENYLQKQLAQSAEGWCYMNDGIMHLSEQARKANGGKYFKTRKEAIAYGFQKIDISI